MSATSQKTKAKQNKNKDKNAKQNRKPLVIAVAIAVPIFVILVLIILFLVPRYRITINGANIESSVNENGVKTITANIDVECNPEEKDGYYVCQELLINGEYKSNRNVKVVPQSDDLMEDFSATDGAISFHGEKVAIKKVVIRENPQGDTVPNTYTFMMLRSEDDKEVVRYNLTVNTRLSEDNLAVINQNPTGEMIVNALKKIQTVDGVCIVTEDNDPNGNLNKTGSYVAAVYFSDSRADLEVKNNPYSDYKDVCDHGTGAGGQIEVYGNNSDAVKRNDYLKHFDGGILSNGEHSVHGNAVFRISEEMPASQMRDLEKQVVEVLTK